MSKAGALTLMVVGLLAVPADAGTLELRAGGTGSATQLLRQLSVGFTEHAGGNHEIIPSLGSTGAINALADGRLDIAVAGRPLKAEEEKKGLKVALIVRTPFVLATSHKEPNALKSADVVQAFLTSELMWRDGTPIRVILRPRSESDVTLMGALIPGLGAAMEMARTRPGIPVAATDQDNADWAEQISGSLIGLSQTQLVLEKRNLRIVPIDGHLPTVEGMSNGTYPYVKKLYFITQPQPSPVVSAFLAFLNSDNGQVILRNAYVFADR